MDEIRHLIEEEKEGLKKDYKEFGERRKLIKQYNKIKKAREKLQQGIDIKPKSKKTPPTKTVSPPEVKKRKSFDEYFQECIENKEFPEDTPPYFREALERAITEYHQGLVKEKSALENFVVKYIFKGDPGLTPIEYFNKVYKTLEDFFTYHRNIKFSMVLVCTMEQQEIDRNKGVVGLKQDKAYFRSGIHINLKSTDVEKLIDKCVKKIIEDLEVYQKNGSGWYFNEVDKLEIHTVDFNPSSGSTYIPLPDWISNKKAIVNIQNKDEKCFIWCILRYLYPRKDNEPD